jgi:hypothetical protein
MQAPYGQQPDPNHHARLLLGLIPEDVKKSASAAELNARLAEARRLGAQAGDMRLDPLLRSQARMHAQQVLTAPRSAAPVQKAIANARTAQLADEAAARAVAKGKARRVAKAGAKAADEEPVPVFDANGQLIGICDPSDIQPVAGAAGRQPSDATAQQVAKALGKLVVYDQRRKPHLADRRSIRIRARGAVAKGAVRVRTGNSDALLVQQVIKGLGPGKWLPVHDWTGTPVGIVKKKHVTAMPPGLVLRAPQRRTWRTCTTPAASGSASPGWRTSPKWRSCGRCAIAGGRAGDHPAAGRPAVTAATAPPRGHGCGVPVERA